MLDGETEANIASGLADVMGIVLRVTIENAGDTNQVEARSQIGGAA
jgi:hypothetical protein|tara:strand:+ start:2201 stop:2338 length:138 start_codon:yes stop_codon:yes gene_type:complete